MSEAMGRQSAGDTSIAPDTFQDGLYAFANKRGQLYIVGAELRFLAVKLFSNACGDLNQLCSPLGVQFVQPGGQ